MHVLPPVSPAIITETEVIQAKCYEVAHNVLFSLYDGISEQEVADRMRQGLKEQGISDYWYNIPFIVLFGEKRFPDMISRVYAEKSPRANIKLRQGDIVYFDIHPRGVSGQWCNFSATGIYKPREEDKDKIAFIETMQSIENEGIKLLRADMTGSDVYAMLMGLYDKAGIRIMDVRATFGHRMLNGEKTKTVWEDTPHTFLDPDNDYLIGGHVLGIETGGTKDGLFGRVEDCVYVPLDGQESARILGRDTKNPFPSILL